MSKTNTFNIGDIVTLKSGGPDMTVRKVYTKEMSSDFGGTYQCQWFAGKKLDSGSFPQESLVAVPKDS
jgi:uncharacterized protein YodC (DUF2158 family)